MAAESRSNRISRFEAFELDRRAGELRQNGQKIRLQEKPLRILELLVERSGDIVTRDELRQGLWPAETFVDFEGGLNTAVNKLRAALGDTAHEPRFVETVGRRGYRFLARVENAAFVNESTPASPSRPVSRRRLGAVTAGGLALAVAVGLLAWRAREDAARATLRSLAVLPLADLSGGSDPYLADGMTEALITELAKIRALDVISRTSAMRYKGTTKSLPEIAAELGVGAVVEGSVLRSGGRVRVTANLIRARSDQHLWAQEYERDVGDLLSLQRDMARAIAGEIGVRLTVGEDAGLASVRSVDAQAQDAYLKGLHYFHQAINKAQVSMEGMHPLMDRSFAFYQEAIRRAPDDAMAHAGLAQAYHWRASMGFPEFFPQAKAEAEKAIALDETVGKAHAALAYTLHNADFDWVGAEREYRRTLELDPAEGHHGFALWLSNVGRHGEAIEHIQRAEQLDPMLLPLKVNAVVVYLQAREYGRAERKARLALDLFPEAAAHLRPLLGIILVHQGRGEEGIAEMRKGLEGLGQTDAPVLAWALAVSGRPAEARAVVSRLEVKARGKPVRAVVLLAAAYAALGDNDRAFELLERAWRQRSRGLLAIKVQPTYDSLRSDARYADLVRRIGFPPGGGG